MSRIDVLRHRNKIKEGMARPIIQFELHAGVWALALFVALFGNY